MGCPAGVGPEIAVRAAADAARSHPSASVVLVGDRETALAAARATRTARKRIVGIGTLEELGEIAPPQIGLWLPSRRLEAPVTPGKPTPDAGAAQLAWIDTACDLVSDGACDALVTAPVSKAVIARSGAPGAKRFKGHTEHLMRRTKAKEVVMAFVGDALSTALVTTHVPLRRVVSEVTESAVSRACFWLGELLSRRRPAPFRVAVTGLNPHAGEGGLLGDEERRVIAPGMKRARRRLRRRGIAVELVGPMGAETAYRLAAKGEYLGVVAMYHDQATIAGKLIGFGEMVNVTLGLPIIRTSVDHGTAYDKAGSGSASADGMRSALALAIELASS
jgi:4-hydroxythreonine-4-phosphate dehydrogenase